MNIYLTPYKEIKRGQEKALKTVGLKQILGMLIREYGYKKVEKELKNIQKEDIQNMFNFK